MDVLTNKQLKAYDKVSRYATFPIYYNKLDDKYMYGTTNWLSRVTQYDTYKIQLGDTIESIALKFYGNPTYYWVIADFNRMIDPFSTLIADRIIKIPVLSSIEFLQE